MKKPNFTDDELKFLLRCVEHVDQGDYQKDEPEYRLYSSIFNKLFEYFNN